MHSRRFTSALTALAAASALAAPAAAQDHALRFDGLTSYGEIATNSAPVEDSTWEAWVKVESYPQGWSDDGSLLFRYGVYNHPPFIVRDQGLVDPFLESLSPAIYCCGGPNNSATATDVVPESGWMHWAAVYQGQEVTLYVNGQPVDTSSYGGTQWYSTSRIMLGAEYFTSYHNFFYGDVDEVRISTNRRYTAPFTPQRSFTSDANTWGLWHFDEGSGSIAADASGNGRDWQLHGNFQWVDGNTDTDVDDDGLLDSDEVAIHGTDPADFDTDGDGLGDGLELGVTLATVPPSTDLNVFVPDADPQTTTDPLLADTDGGGVEDGIEDQSGDGAVDTWETDPNGAGDDDFAFYVRQFEPNQSVIFEVYNATPNALLVPLYSRHGDGPTNTTIGVTLDLTPPIVQLRTDRADQNGRASWAGPRIPGHVRLGFPIYWQAVEVPFSPSQPARASNALVVPIGAN